MAKKQQIKIETKQAATAIKIGQLGDYKPIPRFPKTCANC